jgi:hypothetical protein
MSWPPVVDRGWSSLSWLWLALSILNLFSADWEPAFLTLLLAMTCALLARSVPAE